MTEREQLEKLKSDMLAMRERIRGKSISLRSLKIIDECLVLSGIMKEEDSIHWRLYRKRIFKK